MTIAYPLRVFLDCSTAHLSPSSRAYLDQRCDRDDLVARTPYGWFVWAEEPPDDSVPADLAAIMAQARRLDAEYVLFDCDAPENPALPVFDDTDPDDPG